MIAITFFVKASVAFSCHYPPPFPPPFSIFTGKNMSPEPPLKNGFYYFHLFICFRTQHWNPWRTRHLRWQRFNAQRFLRRQCQFQSSGLHLLEPPWTGTFMIFWLPNEYFSSEPSMDRRQWNGKMPNQPTQQLLYAAAKSRVLQAPLRLLFQRLLPWLTVLHNISIFFSKPQKFVYL